MVVYTIEKGTTALYVLGMLHSEIPKADEDHSPPQKDYFFVWPAIKQTLSEYGKGEAKVQLAGIKTPVEKDITDFSFEVVLKEEKRPCVTSVLGNGLHYTWSGFTSKTQRLSGLVQRSIAGIES